jgi:hypothetical protein
VPAIHKKGPLLCLLNKRIKKRVQLKIQKPKTMKKITTVLFCISILLAHTTQANPIGGRKYATIEIKYKETAEITLGQTIAIGLVAMTDKGKEYKTPGFLAPAVLKTAEWAEFTVEIEGGSYAAGEITISRDLALIKNYEVKIKAASVKNPEIKTELLIKLNFKGTTKALFEGEHGRWGSQGAYGRKGANAVTGTESAGNPGNGGNGSDGGDGGSGQNIEVFVKMQFDNLLQKEMLYALVKSKTTGQEQLFISDPQEGKLIVSANGGDGGSGGDGGQGGQGGDDTYKQTSTNGANGGQGGNGANGGDGGTIIAYMDPSTDKLGGDAIRFTNEAGRAGRPGDAGLAGFKGYYPNATNGQMGIQGHFGAAGKNGPAIKIVKPKVEKIAAPNGNSTPAGNTDTEEAPQNTAPKNAATTTPTSTLVKDASKLPPLDKTKPGYFEEKYENGKISLQGYKLNGAMVGEAREYISNDKSVTIVHYVNGVKEGYSVVYGYDGKLKSEGYFKNDLMEGEWKNYKNGVLVETEMYKEGVLVE